MRKIFHNPVLFLSLGTLWLGSSTFIGAQTKDTDPGQTAPYRVEAPGFFPNPINLYREMPVPPLKLENSLRIGNLIHEGKLELSLSDALALALENNLDIAVQRYVPEYAQTDLLRTKAGQSPRGFSGGTTPGGLTSGALGAGLSGSGAGSGVGSAGGITGGGGAIQVGSSGSFDPTLNISFSYDHVKSPLNSKVVSGIYDVTGENTAFTASFAQLFSLGTSYSVTLNGQHQSSTQQNLLFNPASVTRFAVGVNQPLLNGFGHLPNERYIMVAKNNIKVAEDVFRQQVIDTVVQVTNAYWNLAATQESVKVAEQALEVAQQHYRDNQIRLEVGTMSPLDVTSAESETAARTRDLTVAMTTLQIQETSLKNLLAKKVGDELNDARIVLKDRMPEPSERDIPDLKTALSTALENRTELAQADVNLKNQDISVRFTQNALKPGLGVFGFFAGSGLAGTTTETDTGFFDALGQSFSAKYPEYAGGFSLSLPLRNRTAQADNLRSQIEANQLQITRQQVQNNISMEVSKAIIGLIQGKAQVEAAHKAATLAREIWEGERIKLEAGTSTSYDVIQRERDFTSAQYAEVGAMVTYAKALVEMDRARGIVLEQNHIEYEDALSGDISKAPVTPFATRSSNEEAK